MLVQKYIDCSKCKKRFVICLIDLKRKIIAIFPIDYIERSKLRIYDLDLKQTPNPQNHDQKIITISCPVCGNLFINNISTEWTVEAGCVEILGSSFGVETIENVNIIEGDSFGL